MILFPRMRLDCKGDEELMYFMGLDYGTGSCKGCIVDENLEVVSYASREYEILTKHGGVSEHRASEYWPLTCEIIQECLHKAGIKGEEVKAIGTSSALPSLVMIDQEGKPLHNAYNLMDRRAYREKKWLEEHLGNEKIYEITKNSISDHPILVNLLWEKNNRPESFSKIKKALTIDGYIRFCLTETTTAHLSAGIFYGVAYDIYKKEFDQKILDMLGVPAEILPQFCKCEDIVGTVTKKAAKECGLAEGTLVAAGQVDCNAGWLGGGAVMPGDIQMNLGTCGNFGVIHRGEIFMPEMFNLPYTTDAENHYITVATTVTGGQSLRYLKENFADVETMAAKIVSGLDVYDLLNMEAEKIAPGSDGLLMLPYLSGERTPIWDNEARGVLFGLSLNHGRAHMIRAMMEGVAYALYDSFQFFCERGIKMNYPLVMNEGGAKSKLWRRIITDVFGVPTVLVKSRVGAPYGDALLAARACGFIEDYSITKEKTQYVEPMEPIAENHELYMEYFKIYKSLYIHLKQDFKDIDAIKRKHRKLES